ncbi:MAG: hypothetical protein KDE27_18350 [Planctomycetes bacterium]|nr:hypothetical protein [Planctomycetota bacterium]
MQNPTVLRLLAAALAVATNALPAQDLRRGIGDADLVAVARQIGKRNHDDRVVLHRVQIVQEVFGSNGNTAVTVLDWPTLSMHNRPSPRQSRLYCLKSAGVTAERLGLPASEGPYYKMVGWAGSNPLIGSAPDEDPIVRFAAVIARGKAGASATRTAGELATVAVEGDPAVRTEAARLLTERGDLRLVLAAPQWSAILARAAGETEDVDYKVALAELCAEQRLEGLVETLSVSLGPVQDPRFARCVGRIANLMHGEQATEALERRLTLLRDPADRAVVLRAIGATNTDAALALLLRLDSVGGKDAAVEAALKEHRSPQAEAAVLRRQK